MKEDTKTENKNEDSVIKITIARDLAEGLTELARQVNDGFSAGRVHRQDVASFIIAKFLRTHTESDVQQIREAHYDDSAMFDTVYRKMRETGEVPEFLREAMRKHFRGLGDGSKKSKKQLTDEYTNSVQSKNEDAA